MKPEANGVARGGKGNSIDSHGPNWIVIAGGALLSTLSIHLGCKLKKALDSKRQTNIKGHGKSSDGRRSSSRLNSNSHNFTQEDYGCFNYISGSEGIAGMNHTLSAQLLSESEVVLPLALVPALDFAADNRVMWVAPPDQLELPPKPFHHFHHSNGSDSPSVSESGSDIFSKREVIQKLRQQLKRRDDMIMEMQDQIVELQNSLKAQVSLTTSIQSQLNTANKDLFDCKREIQWLRKAIAGHCVNHIDKNDKPPKSTAESSVSMNGPTNGYANAESNYGGGERIDMLKREVGELKELIEGKEYLLQNYKEQKAELSIKIKELQERLDSQVPTIF